MVNFYIVKETDSDGVVACEFTLAAAQRAGCAACRQGAGGYRVERRSIRASMRETVRRMLAGQPPGGTVETVDSYRMPPAA